MVVKIERGEQRERFRIEHGYKKKEMSGSLLGFVYWD
jgi:hypothetical protein